jgi:hypothetical protein
MCGVVGAWHGDGVDHKDDSHRDPAATLTKVTSSPVRRCPLLGRRGTNLAPFILTVPNVPLACVALGLCTKNPQRICAGSFRAKSMNCDDVNSFLDTFRMHFLSIRGGPTGLHKGC